MTDDEAAQLEKKARAMHEEIKVNANDLMAYWIGRDEATTLDKIMSRIHPDTLRDGCAFFLALASCLDDKEIVRTVGQALNPIVASKIRADYLTRDEPKAPRSGQSHTHKSNGDGDSPDGGG